MLSVTTELCLCHVPTITYPQTLPTIAKIDASGAGTLIRSWVPHSSRGSHRWATLELFAHTSRLPFRREIARWSSERGCEVANIWWRRVPVHSCDRQRRVDERQTLHASQGSTVAHAQLHVEQSQRGALRFTKRLFIYSFILLFFHAFFISVICFNG